MAEQVPAFFRMHGATSSSYSLDRLLWLNVSYVKLPVARSKAYVGSTGKGINLREASRVRKFKQKSAKRIELAIKFWKQTHSFFEFCPIVMSKFQSF